MNPEDWWSATAQLIRQVVQEARIPPSAIMAIGITALQHAAIAVDRKGDALCQAIMWMDLRAQPQVAWLSRNYGDQIAEVMGPAAKLAPMHTVPKLLWMAENHPQLVRRTHKFLWAKDYLRFKLTGQMASDISDARGAFLLHPEWRWATEMMEIIGISPEKLPPLLRSDEIAGHVSPQASRITGLAEGTPVITGCGDVPATLIGCNLQQEQRGCCYIGTAAWLCLDPFSRFLFPSDAFSLRTNRWKIWPASTTGAALEWFRSILEERSRSPSSALVAELVESAATVEKGANGLLFLPHLMGERGLEMPKAKGVLFGLTLNHNTAHITRAILEGTAFLLRQFLELSKEETTELVIAGGGARSPIWRQIIADATGLKILVPRDIEAAGLGAAVLAAVGIGRYRSVYDGAEQAVKIVEDHAPDSQATAEYGALYDIYKKLEGAVKPLYSEL